MMVYYTQYYMLLAIVHHLLFQTEYNILETDSVSIL